MKNETGFPCGKPKPFEDLTFHDDFMFGIVMQDREICREALECMLGMKIARVDYAEPRLPLREANEFPRCGNSRRAGSSATRA